MRRFVLGAACLVLLFPRAVPALEFYGPVRVDDTLWSLAQRLRPDDSVSVQRMMLALLAANPEAFEIGNVNALRAGATLRIPTLDAIGPDDEAAAIAEVLRQHAAWEQHRGSRREAPPPAAPAPPEGEEAPAAAAPAGEGAASPDAASSDVAPPPAPRIEAASPETAPREGAGAASEAAVEVRTLREDLASEIGTLRSRLLEAEHRIEALNRLVEARGRELLALQTKLRAASTPAEPEPAPPEAEPMPEPAPPEAEPMPEPAPPEAEPMPEPAPPEAEPMPEPAPPEAEPMPEPAPPEAEPMPEPAPPEAEPMPEPAPPEAEPMPEPAPPEAEPMPEPAPPEAEPMPEPAPPEAEPMPEPAPPEAEPMPEPAPPEAEPMPEPAPPEAEPMPEPAPPEAEPMPEPAPPEAEPMPEPAPPEAEPMPEPAPPEAEPMPEPAPPEAEPMPEPAPATAEAAPSEPESTPEPAPSESGKSVISRVLETLPINPVIPITVAGLLLVLLGVAALHRRRRAASAPAAVLSADRGDPPAARADVEIAPADDAAGRPSRPAPGDPRNAEAAGRDRPGAGPGHPADAGRAKEWREPGSADVFALGAETEGDAGSFDDEGAFDLGDARVAQTRHSGSRRGAGVDPDETGEAPGDRAALSERLDFRLDEPGREDAGPEPRDETESDGYAFDIGGIPDDAADPGAGAPGEEPHRARVRERTAAPGGSDRAFPDFDPGSGEAGEGADAADRREWDSAATSAPPAGGSPGPRREGGDGATGEGSAEAGRRGSANPTSAPPWEESGPGALAYDPPTGDEVQTKIDLAQAYIEMGDAEVARGFLDEVLAEGDPGQRESARAMLSKLD